jgi:hypothetical protein
METQKNTRSQIFNKKRTLEILDGAQASSSMYCFATLKMH